MNLSPAQRSTLQYMTDHEWHLGAAVARSGATLKALDDAGLIRAAGEDAGFMQDVWTITQAGFDAIHVVTP